MADFSFTKEESALIKNAIAQGHVFWSDKSLDDVKGRLKVYLRQRQVEVCCYCSRNTDDEFKMALDIEHIIPKSVLVSEMFVLNNLAASCKRCNMRIKKDDVSFINGEIEAFKAGGGYYLSGNYKFLHPNLDEWDDHLHYYVVQRNNKKMVYYNVVEGSEKGEYTKEYFRLADIQVNTFDEVQEASGRKEPVDPNVADKYIKLVDAMLGKT
ncbi:HNH endonuclease [Enterobacter hormaechei]|uniref:HNH endonuclease n=1 Tax=Enterobacter hormaechei TaxID=158836 RepID=UPI003D6F3CFE